MTRAELHDLVWSAPLARIAEQFGISTAALRKVCDDYGVPLPSSGYWTKVAFGKAELRKPLSQEPPKIVERFNVSLRRFGRAVLNAADVQIEAYNLDWPSRTVGAPEQIPLLAELEGALKTAPASDQGMLCVDWPPGLRVQVACASVSRATAFVSTFFASATVSGFSISRENGLLLDDELFALRLYETRKKRKGKAKTSLPSGRLCFEIVDPRLFRWSKNNVVGRWCDVRGSRIEDKIRLALADTVNAASLIRSARSLYDRELSRKIMSSRT